MFQRRLAVYSLCSVFNVLGLHVSCENLLLELGLVLIPQDRGFTIEW